MITSIPNPKKDFQVNFSNEEVQKVLSKLPQFMQHQKFGSYTFESYDPIIGELIMTKTEFMSLGVKIVISSHEIGEGKSKIQMEVQRVIGSFDQSYEVTKANEHLNSVTKAISQFLQNPGIDLTSSNENVQDNGEKSSQTSAIVGAIVLGLLVIWILA
jgi:hypothetical protein